MLEIIALILLCDRVAAMARRRGRSPTLFELMLVGLWFAGEVAGAVLGVILAGAGGRGGPDLLVVYGLALAGAAIGGVCAFVIARSVSPVGGAYRDLPKGPFPRSRLVGALVGGVGGGLFGALITGLMFGGEPVEGNLPIVVQGFLAVGTVGALLGLVSGVQKK